MAQRTREVTRAADCQRSSVTPSSCQRKVKKRRRKFCTEKLCTADAERSSDPQKRLHASSFLVNETKHSLPCSFRDASCSFATPITPALREQKKRQQFQLFRHVVKAMLALRLYKNHRARAQRNTFHLRDVASADLSRQVREHKCPRSSPAPGGTRSKACREQRVREPDRRCERSES